MAQLMDLITQAMGGEAHQQIAQQLGTNPQAAQSGIAAALPMLLAGLARNTSSPAGAQALDAAVSRDHDGSILDNLAGFLRNPQAAGGANILPHLFGDQQPMAQQAVASASGIDSAKAGQLLTILAPIVMGALGRLKQQGNLDTSGVAGVVGGEHASLRATSPDLMGMATRLLQPGGEGSLANELGGIAGSLFGRR